MRTTPLFIACALLALVPLVSGQEKRTKENKKNRNAPAAATPEPVKDIGYAVYRMVRLKNIFDPDRRPMPAEGGPVKPTPVMAAGNRNSYLTLTGTMVTETKRLAFFSGSTSDYNKVVKAHDKIGDLVVETISTTHVDLKRGEEPVTLAVGKQLTIARPGAGGENVSAAPAAAVETASPAAQNSVTSATPPAPAQVGDPLDPKEIMRKMMERRQKENR